MKKLNGSGDTVLIWSFLKPENLNAEFVFVLSTVLLCLVMVCLIKVGLSPSNFFICFNGSPSNMMKNAFYFILKALFVLKIFKLLS